MLRRLLLVATSTLAAGKSWIDDAALRRDAEARKPVQTKLFTVNLDLPAEQRWTPVYSDPLFRDAAKDVHAYLAGNIPSWTVPILEGIAKHMTKVFHDYGGEMEAIAKILHAPVSDIVIVNLVYSLETIVSGSDCTLRNVTGPCKPSTAARNGPGACTSFVAQAMDGTVWHGRNLDWNLPASLRKYIFDANFERAGKLLYRGTMIAGLVGAIHGYRPNGFSISLNARDRGGESLLNILYQVLDGKAHSATHLLRLALESEENFDSGLHMLSSTPIAEPVYYIVGGPKAGNGAVVSRDRLKARDVWLLNDTATHSQWFMLETNYDHWEQPPTWDDRRTPGNAHLQALGQSGLNETAVLQVLGQWPTMNNHTDVTGVMNSGSGSYRSLVWLDDVAGAAVQMPTVV